MKATKRSNWPVFKIADRKPWPLIRDFSVYIDYLLEVNPCLSGIRAYLPSSNLLELNRAMLYVTPQTTDNASQSYYPLLHLFYHLITVGKLFKKVPVRGKKLQLLPTDRLEQFRKLTPVEQYFFLLETFWTDLDWSKIQAKEWAYPPLYAVSRGLEYLSTRKPGEEISFSAAFGKDNIFQEPDIFWNWGYFLLYGCFFGFWNINLSTNSQHASLKIRYLLYADSITPSEFGIALAPILIKKRGVLLWNLPARRHELGEWAAIPGSPGPEGYGTNYEIHPSSIIRRVGNIGQSGLETEPFFLPFVPLFNNGELQKTLPRVGVEYEDGIYTFKISLESKIWRRIEVDARHTLMDLHQAIQEAFSFDAGHFFSFFMDAQLWSDDSFCSPDEESGPYADEVFIGELGLIEGQVFLYLFDYGDEWNFRVEFEKIRKDEVRPLRPRVIKSKGEAPPQYREE